MKRFAAALAAAFVMATALFAPVCQPQRGAADPAPCCGQQLVQAKGKPYNTGRKAPPKERLDALVRAAHARHGDLVKRLPQATAATFDCRALGWVPPIVDQGNCGSCWDFSGTGMVSSAFIKAGWFKNDNSARLSEQYTLDCGQNGGCNGDDNTTVLTWAKATGLPKDSDYGPYQQSSGRCKYTTAMTLYKLADWGFCTPSNSSAVAAVQDIKNAMVAYGPIGCAIAADDAFMNVQPGQVFQGNSGDINHDIILVGWDDSKGPHGAWILRNSWGTSWCDGGYCWIAYGANSVGTEAVWCQAPASPNPPPGPLPPTPPPGPNPAPAGGMVQFAGTGTNLDGQTFRLAPPGAAFLSPATVQAIQMDLQNAKR